MPRCKFLSNYSAVRRYIADASYWIYLAHLPVVAASQVWVGHWPLHWGVKYPFILVASFAVLFLSYHFLVRPSFIGQLFNGRKVRAPAIQVAPVSATAGAGAGPGVPRCTASPSATAPTPRWPASTSNCGPASCWRCSGPNGAGKTTAIGLWLGLTEADAGQVTCSAARRRTIDRRRGLGVMMQDVEMYKELRVRELIALASSYYTNPLSVGETLRRAGIGALADRRYGKLSGGQKRQAQFAVAICGRPKVLFLDEPTVGLDIQAREALVGQRAHAARRRLFHRAHHALSRGSRSAGHARGGTGQGPRHRLGQRRRTCVRWWRAGRSAAKPR